MIGWSRWYSIKQPDVLLAFTALFYYWLTDLVSSWNQLSKFSRWDKQNDHFGHLKSMIHNHNNVYMQHKTFHGLILHLSTDQVIKMTFNWCVSCILNYLYFVSEWWKHWITVSLDPGWDIITTKCKNNTSAFSARITLWIQQKSFSNNADRSAELSSTSPAECRNNVTRTRLLLGSWVRLYQHTALLSFKHDQRLSEANCGGGRAENGDMNHFSNSHL